MGNTQKTYIKPNSRNSETDSNQNSQIYDEILRLLSTLCNDDQFPLNIMQRKNDTASSSIIIDVISSLKKSEELTLLLVKLLWSGRARISREEITKLFLECCAFDLKQALVNDKTQLQTATLDHECFSALTNSIGSNTTSEIGQEEFYQWVRAQFPTLFYGFEIWLRKNSALNKSQTISTTMSASNQSLIATSNVLNPTWIWLLAHHIPIAYMSADNSCSHTIDRISSILHNRMWDHLYDSYRDGASLNRFQHHIFGYRAPIIILFEISDAYLFCLCCDEEFKESAKHYGGIQSCLYQLKPVFKLVVEGPNIIFMNTKLRGVSALGLFIGRDHSHVFLSIDGDFFNVKHLNGTGRLVAIDVWGAGGRQSTEDQGCMRQWEERQVEKTRKVKRSYEEEEAILNMAGIQTRHAQEHI